MEGKSSSLIRLLSLWTGLGMEKKKKKTQNDKATEATVSALPP